MKREDVIRKLKEAAKDRGVPFATSEMTKHTAITVGGKRSALTRSSKDFPDKTAHKFWDQFANELGGKGWWR